MEPAAQPSFIPRDAATEQGSRRRTEGGLSDLLLMIGIVALASSIALAVGVFLYQQFLRTTINSDLAKLKQARQQFDPNLVEQLTRLDDRMHSAEALLGIHIAPTAFFAALNAVTAQTVSFTNLEFEVNDPKRITIKMTGVGQSVNSIAFQADLLSKSGVFTSPIFSNLDRQKDGVHFSLTAFVDPAKINFQNLVTTLTPQAAAVGAATSSPSLPNSPFGGAPAQ